MEANPDRPGAHKASWGTRGSFPLRHSGRSVGLTTHIYLMSRLIMSGDTEYITSRTTCTMSLPIPFTTNVIQIYLKETGWM
jgi:hypothetical protein